MSEHTAALSALTIVVYSVVIGGDQPNSDDFGSPVAACLDPACWTQSAAVGASNVTVVRF